MIAHALLTHNPHIVGLIQFLYSIPLDLVKFKRRMGDFDPRSIRNMPSNIFVKISVAIRQLFLLEAKKEVHYV